jgi:cell division initiation protein
MKVTPLEIRQQQFPLRFRGLDPAEVDKFLELVASEMEDLIKDNARLKESLAKREQEIQRLQHGDDELKKALLAIQQVRDDWVGRAEKQAEQLLMESEHKAKQMLQDAEKKLEAIEHDVQELNHQKHQLVAQIRHILEQHLRLLETFEDESEDASPEALQ